MQNWPPPAASRASARSPPDVSRVNIRARCNRPLNWRKDRGGLSRELACACTRSRGEKPRSEIVNTFLYSPIFRATTAQPLVKSHASSSPPRNGAPFRRPLRHSIVWFRAPTTPGSRKRNDHVPWTGVSSFPTRSRISKSGPCVNSHPESASRLPRIRAHLRCDQGGSQYSPSHRYCVYVNRELYRPAVLEPLFYKEDGAWPTYDHDYVEVASTHGENRFEPRYKVVARVINWIKI